MPQPTDRPDEKPLEEESAEGSPEETDEHAWHLGIGAPTVRTWLMDDAGPDDESAEEDIS